MATTAPEQSPDSRYTFLVQNILGSFTENGGICLVVSDLSVQGALLRQTIEQIYQDLWVFEVPCRQAIASRIIPNLAQLVSSASQGRFDAPAIVASPGINPHAPMLFICDGADNLGDEQLDAMYNLSRGNHGPLGVVLIAKPNFLRRLKNSRLNHITGALSACLWSQRSSYGTHFIAGPDGKKAGLPAIDVALPSPMLEMSTIQDDASAAAQDEAPWTASTASTLVAASQAPPNWRRRILHICFSIAYLLIAAVTADVLSHISNLHTPSDTIAAKAPSQSGTASTPEPRSAADITSSLASRKSPSISGRSVERLKPTNKLASQKGIYSESDTQAEQVLPPPLPEVRSIPTVPSASRSAPDVVIGMAEALKPKKNIAPPRSSTVANTPENTAPTAAGGEPLAYRHDAAVARNESSENTKLMNPAPNSGQQKSTPEPEPRLSASERVLFVQRGDELLSEGDIASARLFFERAANAGDARAAFEMARSFDPVELAKVGARGVKGDQAQADFWYQRAHLLAGDKDYSGPNKGKIP